jgi:trans-aconitate 2-methyltransferase
MKTTWNAEHYLKFGTQRTRPAADLVSRIQVAEPQTIVDLGCGPGNSTQVLISRWPNSKIIGVDSSTEMIEAARKRHPNQEWIIADASKWSNQQTFDVVFSNAMLHWIPDHPTLISHLYSLVAEGGALAFQIPCGTDAPVRRHMQEISHDPQWSDGMDAARSTFTVEDASVYYDVLSPHSRMVDIWKTTYIEIMDSAEAIIDWLSSTGLRPYLDALSTQAEYKRFVEMLTERVANAYPTRNDGKVLFPFERLFVVAYRNVWASYP